MCSRQTEDYTNVRLETKDLIIKKAVESDWKDIYENLWKHDESARFMLWKPVHTEEDAIERMKKTLAYQKENKYALFIYEKSSGKAIGFLGMEALSPDVYEETGIAFGPAFTGRGYGPQILNALIEEAKACGAKKLIGTCRKQNLPSHKMQMKCGFTFSHDEDRYDPRTGEAYVLEFNERIL